jgi:uncharacterized protein (TIGR03437 family)
MLRFLPLLAGASLAFAQQYSISTIAGGAPPATPVAANAAAIGQPKRVATDAAGNLYFTSGNSVFKMSASGNLTLVAGNSRAGFSGDGGPAASAQLNAPLGQAIDKSANLYIADSGNNRVRIVTTDGRINTFAGNGQSSPGGARSFNDGGPATQALLHLPSGVAVDANGNVYIADTGDNLIRIVTPDGNINQFAGDSYPAYLGESVPAVDAELQHPQDVAVDSSGNVYVADTGNVRIRKITTDGMLATIAGSGAIGYSGDTGPATSASLLPPAAITVDSSGNIFFAESSDARIRKIDTKGVITTVAGNGTSGFSGDGNAATSAQMSLPTGIAVDSSGNLYIADSQNLRVRKVAGSNINSVAGNGLLSFSGDNGPALQAQMYLPQGVAVDSGGNVYVSDTGNNEVRRVGKDGSISRYAGNGSAGFGGDGGAATSAQLTAPAGLAVDSGGNLYIADSLNSRVRKVTPSGSISTVAGNGNAGFGGDNGSATGAQLNTPVSVAVDAAGNLYIADLNNNRIRMVNSGGTITTFAGSGNQGYGGDSGPATSAMLNLPRGVAVDPSGNVFIADSGNQAIREVTKGNISTIAGNGTPDFTGDGGPAVSAQLASPSSVAVDAFSNVVLTDGTGRVRRISSGGTINTIAGTSSIGYSGDGGQAVKAQLNGPSAVAIDSAGNIYVADTNNQAVRLLTPSISNFSVSAVVNGASNQTGLPVAPGEVIVLYGFGLGPSTLASAQLTSSGLLSTSVAGTSVLVNGVLAPMLYASSTQAAAIVPFGVTGPTAQISVASQGATTPAVTLNVVPTSPGVFTANSSGSGQAIAINVADGSVNGPNNPAAPGSYVTLYATGAGQTSPGGVNGRPGTVSTTPIAKVTATIGGQSATVQYAGDAQGIVEGVIQVNVQVPAGLTSGAQPVVLQIGGISSQSGVTITVAGGAQSAFVTGDQVPRSERTPKREYSDRN